MATKCSSPPTRPTGTPTTPWRCSTCARGKGATAFPHFEQALRHKPDYAEARVNFGIALAQDKQLDRAIAQFEQALQRTPGFVQAHFNLGMALALQGRVAKARPHLDEVIRQRPDMAANIEERLLQLGR